MQDLATGKGMPFGLSEPLPAAFRVCLKGCSNRQSARLWRFNQILLTMKFMVILLFITGVQVSGKGYTQSITLNLQNAPIEKVFEAIKSQTGYNFFYAADLPEKVGLVSVKVERATIEEALKQCLQGKPFTYKIINSVVIINSREVKKAVNVNTAVPFIDVKGRVVNENGEPVGGVTVTIKGSKNSTSTNSDGEFSIGSVDPEAILVFSHVALETFEYRVSGKSELAIVLKTKVSSLGDVTVTVNTGYQTIPKERATGAFGIVNNQQINRKSGTDILSRLEGVTTGLIFDRRELKANQNSISPSNILIRGLSTLSTDIKSPLIVVDNFPYEGDINNINPNDVENITILKDAAAASIWGARAGNGVIVITTKRGQYNQPVKVSLNSNMQVTSSPDLFANPKMTTAEFIELEQFLFDKGQYNSQLLFPFFGIVSPVVDILARKKAGTITAQQAAEQIDVLKNYDVRNEFDKYVYRKGINNQYALNFSGGSAKLKYSVSGGYDRALSTLVGNDLNRITFRSASSMVPVKNLEINLGVAYTNTTVRNNSLGDIGSANYGFRNGYFYPYARFADENGNPLPIARDFKLGYTDTVGAGKLLDWTFRPLEELWNADNKSRLSDILFNIGVSYRLNSLLTLAASYQFENSKGENRSLFSEATYFTRDLINRFTQIQGNNIKYILPRGGILDLNNNELLSHVGRTQINFNKNWNSIHVLNGIIGGEIRENKMSRETVRFYGFNPNRYTASSIDYINPYPQIPFGSARITDPSRLLLLTDRFVSVYSNISYSYKGRYTLSGSARKDAANVFGVKSNNRWKPLWSAGAAWNIHQESFYKVPWLSSLRLRATYGYQGNVNNTISPYSIISYSLSNNVANDPWAFIVNAANPQLAWESSGQLNIGVDFAMGQRITGSIDVYRKRSNNLLWNMPIDATTGVLNVKSNSATMVGKGLEGLLRTINVRRIIQWESEFGISYNTNKVLDYVSIIDNKLPASTYANTTGLTIIGRKGRSPFSMFSYPFAGLDPATGDPQGYLGKNVSKNYNAIFNQLYDTSNIIYHGSAIPVVNGFLNQILKYKGWSLIININYKLGYYFRKNTISYFNLINFGTQHTDYSRRWQHTGDEQFTAVPSFVYPVSNSDRDAFYAQSSVNVLKGDHIRLQNIRLSYDLSRTKWKSLPFQSIQFYGNIENIGIIWRANDQELDPDYDTGNAAFPVPKMVTAGLNLNF